MKPLLPLVVAMLAVTVLAAVELAACSSTPAPVTADGGGSLGPDATLMDAGMPSTVGTVSGSITDLTGKPVGGVTIASGAITTQSAGDGTYSLTGLAPANGTPIMYLKDTYLPTAEHAVIVAGATTPQNVVLVGMVPSIPLDATKGGTVSGLRGATLTAGPGAFVDPAGNVVAGIVDVFLRPLDPAVSQELAAYPGTLAAVDPTGKAGLLQTYGLLEVTVQQKGVALQVTKGKTLTIKVPATVLGGPPAQSSLWGFNTATAAWEPEGTAALADGFYTGTLQHLCWHTVSGLSIQAACFTGIVEYADGGMFPYATSVISGAVPPAPPDGMYFSNPTGMGSSYCIWGEPGAQTRLTATAATTGGTMQGSIVVDNQVMPFPDVTGVSAVGSCFMSGTTPFPGCQPAPPIILGKNGDDAGGASPSCAPPADAGADGGPRDGGVDGGDPFAGTCAAPVATFLSCFNGSGGCSSSVSSFDGGTVTTTFGSGASLQFIPNGSSGTGTLEYFGPGMKMCGSGLVNTASSDIDLSLPEGVFVLSSQSIVCPSGQVVPLTPTESSTVSGCQSANGSGNGACGGSGQPPAGDGGGSGFSCTYSGTPSICQDYPSIAPAAIMILQTSCVSAMGTPGTGCPPANRDGCCATKAATFSTCYYGLTPAGIPGQAASCTQGGGIWTSG